MTHADWLILGYTTVIIIFGIVFMHKSVVTNNVYIEHRPHPHFCNAIKQGYSFNLLTVCQARRDKRVVVIIICS